MEEVNFSWKRAQNNNNNNNNNAPPNDDIMDDRPERLGLGASYIPHKQAVQLTNITKTIEKSTK